MQCNALKQDHQRGRYCTAEHLKKTGPRSQGDRFEYLEALLPLYISHSGFVGKVDETYVKVVGTHKSKLASY